MMATIDSANITGARSWDATGNIGSENRRNPYPPILSRIAARMTEPAVGASTWASGSQVCTGHIGNFTANEAKKASQNHFCIEGAKAVFSSTSMSLVPAVQYIVMIASSISSEPVTV